MNSPKHSVTHRLAESRREEHAATPQNKQAERKEALVLLAIAALLVANLVVYLCHHYGLTSLNDWRPFLENAPRVIVD